MTAPAGMLGWSGIARLGLIQAAIGAIVVLTTSTLNRVMVIELHLAASVPGVLVGLHYALQMLRPRWGHGADGARRTPWIVGGMAVLALGGTIAAASAALIATSLWAGLAVAAIGFVLIGIGVGASGTALLTLLADGVAPDRRAAAASIAWIMMILGFIAATVVASIVLTPFSFQALVALAAGVGGASVVVTLLAVRGLERGLARSLPAARPPFKRALETVWADPEARRFAIFIFVSMLAYSAQDLILEPFAGIVFALAPAQTTALTSLQNGGVLVGMVAVAVFGRRVGGGSVAGMRAITLAGCLMSAAALVLIAIAGAGQVAPLIRPAIVSLGFANGVFAIAAVGLMMTLAGPRDGAGVRMGVWGAAQAIAFGGGGFAGTLAVDAARVLLGATVPAYALVFVVEAALFVLAAAMMRTARRDAFDHVLMPAE
jgi:BCD family chlorophyll transporter-like MFS transporter